MLRKLGFALAVPVVATMLMSAPAHADWRGYHRGPGPGAVIAGGILGLAAGAAIAGAFAPPPPPPPPVVYAEPPRPYYAPYYAPRYYAAPAPYYPPAYYTPGY